MAWLRLSPCRNFPRPLRRCGPLESTDDVRLHYPLRAASAFVVVRVD